MSPRRIPTLALALLAALALGHAPARAQDPQASAVAPPPAPILVLPADPAADGPAAVRAVHLDVKGIAGEKTYLDVRLADVPGPRPVAVIVHGWAAGTGDFGALAQHLATRGFAAALFEEPHNWSGDTEEWASQLRNAITALEQANALAGGPLEGKLDLARLGVVGHSYGGAAVVWAAADDPRIKAVVALAPVNQWHKDHLMAHARGLAVPLLVEAGGGDWLAGRDFTRGVYDSATGAPDRQLVEIKGGDHNLYQDHAKNSQEHAIASRYMTAWLERFLTSREDPAGYTTGVAAQADEKAKKLSDAAEASLPLPEPVPAPAPAAPRDGFTQALGLPGE